METQKSVSVYWDSVVVGSYSLDLLINHSLVIELKVCSALTDVHRAQTINYLRATDQRLALLLNFGTPKLQVRRLISSSR